MSTTETQQLQNELRERICEIVQKQPFAGKIGHYEIAEAMVQSAFAWCDFNGGIDDTCHAAKRLHQLVDEAGEKKDSSYSPEKLQEYLRKAGRS